MIPDKALERRLNGIREGAEIPEPPKEIQKPLINFQEAPAKKDENLKLLMSHHITTLIVSLIVSFFYGFGLEALFSQNWSFLGTIGVGFLLNQFVILLFKFFNKSI